MQAAPSTDVRQENYRAAQQVTKIGTAADILLTLAKLIIGYLSHSAALVAELSSYNSSGSPSGSAKNTNRRPVYS